MSRPIGRLSQYSCPVQSLSTICFTSYSILIGPLHNNFIINTVQFKPRSSYLICFKGSTDASVSVRNAVPVSSPAVHRRGRLHHRRRYPPSHLQHQSKHKDYQVFVGASFIDIASNTVKIQWRSKRWFKFGIAPSMVLKWSIPPP